MKKVQIGLSEHALDRIEELRRALGESSAAEVLRGALNLYSWLFDQVTDGYRAFVFRDGTCKEIVLFRETEKGALAFLHDSKAALAAYQRAVEQDLGSPEGWNQLGHLLRRTGALSEAERAYQQVLRLAGDDRFCQAEALGNLGLIYQAGGELEQAEQHYKRALTIDEALRHKEGMANRLGNLGNIYLKRGELDQAEKRYKQAIALNRELGRKESMANQLGTLGTIDEKRGEPAKAMEHYMHALAVHEELGRKEGMAVNLGNLGLIYVQQGELDKARAHWSRAIALYKEVGFLGPPVEECLGWMNELNPGQ